MNTNNDIVQLCTAGARAEFEHRLQDARALYQQAWDRATDHYEAAIAAHYVARCQDTTQDTLRWNQEALARAEAATAAGDARVDPFYPSLYLSLGQAHEQMGNRVQAEHFYSRAAALGAPHRMNGAQSP